MSDLPTSLMKADDLSVAAKFAGAQWGIFGSTGGVILSTNSVGSVEYARDWKISDYPQEKGAFQSYNKVQIPYQAKITYIITDTRQQFLNSVEKAVASLEFVTVVTPEIQYANANLTHYDYRRVKENASLIQVTVWCEEVRMAGQSQLSNTNADGSTDIGQNTASTSGAETAQGGVVQPAEPTDVGGSIGAPDLPPPQ